MSETREDHRQVLVGWVVSDKMNKTRVVEVRWSKRDPNYGKVVNRNTKIYVHDEKNESKAGDRVRVSATRPLSRLKSWRLSEILNKA